VDTKFTVRYELTFYTCNFDHCQSLYSQHTGFAYSNYNLISCTCRLSTVIKSVVGRVVSRESISRTFNYFYTLLCVILKFYRFYVNYTSFSEYFAYSGGLYGVCECVEYRFIAFCNCVDISYIRVDVCSVKTLSSYVQILSLCILIWHLQCQLK
jgi:hypothetical protein